MTRVSRVVRELAESVIGEAPFEVGDRVIHPKDGLVEITSGQYWGTHGLSNFWYWKKVLPDGTLDSEERHGYGWTPEIM